MKSLNQSIKVALLGLVVSISAAYSGEIQKNKINVGEFILEEQLYDSSDDFVYLGSGQKVANDLYLKKVVRIVGSKQYPCVLQTAGQERIRVFCSTDGTNNFHPSDVFHREINEIYTYDGRKDPTSYLNSTSLTPNIDVKR